MKNTNATKVTTIINEANELFAQREKFENTVLARTNKKLYEILASVYSLYLKAEVDNCMKETIKAMTDELSSRDVRIQKNTQKMTVFVRFVFNSDRKRAHNYTQTLLSAIDNSVMPEDLADFITDNAGVEEIKRSRKVNPEQTEKKKALEASISEVKDDLCSMQPVKTLIPDEISVDLSDADQFAFVIARVSDNQELELLTVISKPSTSMLNAAYKALALQANDSKEANTVKVTKKRSELAISNAAKSLAPAHQPSL